VERVNMTAEVGGDDRLLETLQRLLGVQAVEMRPMLDEASSLVAAALAADKVDVFLYEAASDSLVAMGTSATELGQRQHELGLNRLPVANGGPTVRVFLTGEPYQSSRTDRDPDQLRGVVDGLGVRSQMDVPLDVDGRRRGVLSAESRQPDFFTQRDLRFLAAVAGWIGVVTHRAELSEQVAAEAERRGRRQVVDELARLTPREREVVVLIAEGLTNAEIALRLTVVEGTVANHVEHILRKLKLRSRTQVAVWAVEHGLYRLPAADSDA